jgi:hypothetical protein
MTTSCTNVDKLQRHTPPPWHTLVAIVAIHLWFFSNFPSLESLDEVANQETLMNVKHPNVFSIEHIATIRLILGAVMILDTLFTLGLGSWEQSTMYFPGSKLKVAKIPFRGVKFTGSLTASLRTLSSATVWCFMAEGITFVMLGAIPWYVVLTGKEPSRWIMRLAFFCWEAVAPASMMVSATVKYVLWPMALMSKDPSSTDFLKSTSVLLKHNWNILSSLLEVALLGAMPIRYADFSVGALLLGLPYLCFTYYMMYSWVDIKRHGPQFIYPFFDTTMGYISTLCIVGILGMYILSHASFAWLHRLVVSEPFASMGVGAHIVAVVIAGAALCRLRD